LAGQLAFLREGDVWLAPLPAGEAHPLTDHGEAATPALSPDGKHLVYVRQAEEGSDLYLIDLATAQERRLTEDLEAFSPTWSWGGKHLGYLRWPATDETAAEETAPSLWPVILENLTTRHRFETFHAAWPPQFVGDEEVLIGEVDENEELQALWKLKVGSDEGTQVALPKQTFDRYFSVPAISPEGKKLAYLSFDPDKGQGHIVQTLDGQVLLSWGLQETMDSESSFPPPVWSPTGERVLFDHSDLARADQVGLWVVDLSTSESRRLVATGNLDPAGEGRLLLTGVAWSPDGQYVAVGQERTQGFGEEEKQELTVEIRSVATGECVRVLKNAAEPSWGRQTGKADG